MLELEIGCFGHLVVQRGRTVKPVAVAAVAAEELRQVGRWVGVVGQPVTVRGELVVPLHCLRNHGARQEMKPDAVAERLQDPGYVGRYLAGDEGFVVHARDGHSLTEGSRLFDEAPCLPEVGCAPGPVRAWAQRVGAVAAVARQAGRERLAGRGGEAGPTVHLDDRAAVDRVVECLPDQDVAERGKVRVEVRKVNNELRAGVQLGGSLQAELAVLRLRDQAEDPVGSSVLDGGDGVLAGWHRTPHDRVRITGRLGGTRPLVEERVAGETDLGAADGNDLVRARPWYGPRAGFVVGGSRGDRGRKGLHGELEKEAGVARGEPEGDGAGRVVGNDPAGKVATGGVLSAGGGADDAGEVGLPWRADAEQALDPTAEVAGPQGLAVGVADPGPEAELVAGTAVRRSRDREREVGYQPQSVGARALLEGDEGVVRQPDELGVAGVEVERRIDRRGRHCSAETEAGGGHDR